jgi:hypothetical protein
MSVLLLAVTLGASGCAGSGSVESATSQDPEPASPARSTEQRLKTRGQRLYEHNCPVPEYGGPCAEGPMAFER